MCDKNESPNKNINCKSTPPPTNRKIRNPFDRVLVENLHNPICSPDMCKIYKKRNNGSFRWDIDQACILVPADIVACNSQFEPSPDPVLEKIAEEASEKFFSQEMVMPSPLESSKKVQPLIKSNERLHINKILKETVVTRDVSAQTVLTLPPELPPELEKILEPFCTFTQDQNLSGEYEITANGSLRRKLFFEEHSDMEHYDSEQTDDEAHVESCPPTTTYEVHVPVKFSPDDLRRDLVSKGMKRTFGTPMKSSKPYRNKILDIEPCFSPIEYKTPNSKSSGTSSLASVSISPVNKVTSSDEEKNNFTSPESEAMATCLDCVTDSGKDKVGTCVCKNTCQKIILKRSASLKESPPRSRKSSLSMSEKRSLSMSSLHRSRSVQKLDFSMDMSIDGSVHDHGDADSESSPQDRIAKCTTPEASWSMVDETNVQNLGATDTFDNQTKEIQSSTKLESAHILDATPIKSKNKSVVLSHEISKIRAPLMSPLHMSLDNSLDNSDTSLSLEHKNIDFNTIDLKFLTENVSHFNNTSSKNVMISSESSTSLKKVDSGFNENTFYANASSYYESAIKPSELTITNTSSEIKTHTNKTALKEISNVPWMRVDSGFKDETSTDNSQFYHINESSIKKGGFQFSEVLPEDKENIVTENFDKFLGHGHTSSKSMSDIFNDDMTFNCNFSSTPSKNKSRKVHL